MRRKGPETIILPLRDLRDLFAAPELDLAATDSFEDELYEPGLDHLVSRLRGNLLARRGQLVLALPAGRGDRIPTAGHAGRSAATAATGF